MNKKKSNQIVLVALCDYAARYGKGLEFQGIVESLERKNSQLHVMGIFRDRGVYSGNFKLIHVLPGGNLIFRAVVLLEKWLDIVGIKIRARRFQDSLFDWLASWRIPQDCVVLMTLPGMTRTLKRAKKLGAQTVLHGVVMHPTYNRNLLARCYLDSSEYPSVYDDKMIAEAERSMEFVDTVICPSCVTSESYVDNGFSADKVFLAPLGYERPQFKPEVLPWKSNERLKIIFIGNITKMKGVDIILKAADMLDESRFEFHFCGDIQNDMKIEVSQKWKYYSNIIFHGYVPSLNILPTCHVFVFMSLSEGQPKAVLEASHCGLLVVANKYFHADLVVDGETGLICDQDPCYLANILDDVERHRDKYLDMRKRLQKACESLSWEKFGDNVRDVLLRLKEYKLHGNSLVSDTAANSARYFDR